MAFGYQDVISSIYICRTGKYGNTKRCMFQTSWLNRLKGTGFSVRSFSVFRLRLAPSPVYVWVMACDIHVCVDAKRSGGRGAQGREGPVAGPCFRSQQVIRSQALLNKTSAGLWLGLLPLADVQQGLQCHMECHSLLRHRVNCKSLRSVYKSRITSTADRWTIRLRSNEVSTRQVSWNIGLESTIHCLPQVHRQVIDCLECKSTCRRFVIN